jgi:hypothetical protein
MHSHGVWLPEKVLDFGRSSACADRLTHPDGQASARYLRASAVREVPEALHRGDISPHVPSPCFPLPRHVTYCSMAVASRQARIRSRVIGRRIGSIPSRWRSPPPHPLADPRSRAFGWDLIVCCGAVPTSADAARREVYFLVDLLNMARPSAPGPRLVWRRLGSRRSGIHLSRIRDIRLAHRRVDGFFLCAAGPHR